MCVVLDGMQSPGGCACMCRLIVGTHMYCHLVLARPVSFLCKQRVKELKLFISLLVSYGTTVDREIFSDRNFHLLNFRVINFRRSSNRRKLNATKFKRYDFFYASCE